MFTHHAQLIVGSYSELLENLTQELTKNDVQIKGNPDVLSQEFDVFGVDDARRLSDTQLRTSVEGGKKIFIIGWRQATVEAQNALLKVFEEPNPGTHFFIITPQQQLLLPTLLSRLTVLQMGGGGMNVTKEAKLFAQAGAGERIEQIQTIITEKNIGAALALLDNLEHVYHEAGSLRSGAGEMLMEARRNLATRSPSLKLILEHLALVIPKI